MANVFLQPCDDGVVRAAPDRVPCTRSQGRWVLTATIIGSSMAFIDGTVVNVALPVLQREFDTTIIQMQWVVESYALFLAALILVGGVLGDHYGRRRVFSAGIAIFAAASVWCGAAPNANQLIVARAVQGVGAALLVPGSLAMISHTFSEEQRGRAIGTWAGFTALAMAVGPVLGGWLVDNVSWRWVFYINIPPALLVLVILYLRVPESRDATRGVRLDWIGAALATVGLGAVVLGLIEAGHKGFADPLAVSALILGALSLAGFILVEWRGDAPMMPLALFRSPSFSGANLLTLLLYAALGGGLFFFPFNLIQVQGYSATAAGAAFLPFILIMALLSRWSGGLVARYGGRLPLVVGPIIAAAGFALFALPGIGGSYWTTFFPAMVVLGLGMAISVAPLTTVIMSAVHSERAGVASGINNAASRVAALLAVAVMGIAVSSAFNSRLDGALDEIELAPAVRRAIDAERIKLAGAEAPPGLDAQVTAAVERAIDRSYVGSFRMIMLLSAGLALMGAASAALTINSARPADDPDVPA